MDCNETTPTKETIMSKKRKNPLFMLAECVGSAIVAVALTPLYIIDAVIAS
jgi:hypothetical protein